MSNEKTIQEYFWETKIAYRPLVHFPVPSQIISFTHWQDDIDKMSLLPAVWNSIILVIYS